MFQFFPGFVIKTSIAQSKDLMRLIHFYCWLKSKYVFALELEVLKLLCFGFVFTQTFTFIFVPFTSFMTTTISRQPPQHTKENVEQLIQNLCNLLLKLNILNYDVIWLVAHNPREWFNKVFLDVWSSFSQPCFLPRFYIRKLDFYARRST